MPARRHPNVRLSRREGHSSRKTGDSDRRQPHHGMLEELQIQVTLTSWQRHIADRTYEDKLEAGKERWQSEIMREKQIAESIRNKFVATFPYVPGARRPHCSTSAHSNGIPVQQRSLLVVERVLRMCVCKWESL